MSLTDPTFFASRRSPQELEQMAIAGVTSVVEPCTWTGTQRRFAESFLDQLEQLLTAEASRVESFGLGYGVALGVAPEEALNPAIAQRLVDALPRYLKHERVVALGELGLGQGTRPEEHLFRQQLRLALAHAFPVMVRLLPHDRYEGARRLVGILEEEGLPPQQVLVNGVTEETFGAIRAYGPYFGLTLDGSPAQAERAAHLLRLWPEGAMLHSAAGRDGGDPLAVPRAARRMLHLGFSPEEVERVTFHHPREFFSQSRPLRVPPADGRREAAASESFLLNLR